MMINIFSYFLFILNFTTDPQTTAVTKEAPLITKRMMRAKQYK